MSDYEVLPTAREEARPEWSFFKRLAAAIMADEVAVLVRKGMIDARSPAADALLDFRTPPSTPRADRLAILEAEHARLAEERDALRAQLAAAKARAARAWEAGRDAAGKAVAKVAERETLTVALDALVRAEFAVDTLTPPEAPDA